MLTLLHLPLFSFESWKIIEYSVVKTSLQIFEEQSASTSTPGKTSPFLTSLLFSSCIHLLSSLLVLFPHDLILQLKDMRTISEEP